MTHATTAATHPPRLAAEHVRLAYDDRVVIDDLTLHVPAGRFTAIVGPNACGKSTLLRALARLLRPAAGVVLLDGEPITARPTRDVARVIGLLPQSPLAPDGLTVADLVARGRHPHQRWLRRWTAEDEAAVSDALAATGAGALADRQMEELSGGQRQRVWIALVLAQDTPILLLDEPTTYLDLAHQIDVLDLLARLNRDHGRTIVTVLHDLNHAARYADHLVAMREGRIIANGHPRDIVDAALIEEVFGLPVRILDDPDAGTPIVVPAARRCQQ